MRGFSGRRAFPPLVYAALAVLCVTALFGARKTMRGFPLGSVVDVNRSAGIISIDLGYNHAVLKGMGFTVVDGKGNQKALIAAEEVYDDLSWSGVLGREIADLSPGMEVRWVLTPEITAYAAAWRKGTAQSYSEFVGAFPKSRFIPEVVSRMPEEMLREVDPAYYEAWKSYTADGFREYIAEHPGTGLSAAAEAEIKSIEEYEAEQQKIKEEREKRAKIYQEERERQERINEVLMQKKLMREAEEVHGKLVNNSSVPVRFVFDAPCMIPPTKVDAGGYFEVRHPAGVYTYKVFAIEAVDEYMPLLDEPVEPVPLYEGSADMQYDFFSIEYP